MENLDDKIKAFLSVSYGYGRGDGYGDGYGNGNGNGDGYGDGYDGNGDGYGDGNGDGYGYGRGDGRGYGDGNGNGYGDGYGDGNSNGRGMKEYKGYKIHEIDEIPTLITSIKGNIAKGLTARNNMFVIPCYVAKVGNCFAHGQTAKQALAEAQAKYNRNKPIEERIADFIQEYPTLDTIAENAKLFIWHNTLTGSCSFGRKEFARQHNIDIDNGSMTISEFIELTKNSYGDRVIRQLLQTYVTNQNPKLITHNS